MILRQLATLARNAILSSLSLPQQNDPALEPLPINRLNLGCQLFHRQTLERHHHLRKGVGTGLHQGRRSLAGEIRMRSKEEGKYFILKNRHQTNTELRESKKKAESRHWLKTKESTRKLEMVMSQVSGLPGGLPGKFTVGFLPGIWEITRDL